jgi:hypothetical protein
MIFWILVALVVIVIVFTFIAVCRDEYSDGGMAVGITVIIGVFSAVIAGLLMVLVWWWGVSVTPFEPVREKQTSLRAIETRDSVEGGFSGGVFASYGYVNGTRVISYVTQAEDGGIRLGYVRAALSVVYEGEENPYLKTVTYEKNNWIFAPWSLEGIDNYEIHVPEGSVTDSFSIAP